MAAKNNLNEEAVDNIIKENAQEKRSGKKTNSKGKKGDDIDFSDLSLEESFEQLEGVLTKMEDEDVTLEESFSLFMEGTKLVEACNSKIDRVEKQVQMITEGGDLADFPDME